MIKTDNKNSYFRLKFQFPLAHQVDSLIVKLEEKLDIVFTRLGITDECFLIYDNKNINSLEVLFRTEQRRRLGVVKNTICRLIELYDRENEPFETNYKLENAHKPELVDCCSFTKNNFYDRLAIIQNDDRYLCKSDISKYDGTDIEIFNEKKNYYTWQLKLEQLLFTKDGEFQPANEREIIYILDESGCSGKSTYWKHLLIKYNREIGVLSEANSGQLKSALCRMGRKKLYVVDLPRTSASIGINDLLNVLEQLKSGLVINNMYGVDQTLVVPPVHVVVSGNYIPYGSLSPDRWKVFKLTEKNNSIDWIDISQSKQREAKQEIEIYKAERDLERAKKRQKVLKGIETYKLKKHQGLANSLKESAA